MSANFTLKRSGASANLTYYGEPGPERNGRIWCEVLCAYIRFSPGGKHEALKPNVYSIRVYRTGTGQVADFPYHPKTTTGDLPARTVTRLVRRKLGLA